MRLSMISRAPGLRYTFPGPVRRNRRCVQGGKPFPHVLRRDVGNHLSREPGQDMFVEIVPVSGERARFPMPTMTAERVSATVSSKVSPSGRPKRRDASRPRARSRASATVILAGSPMIFHMRWPSCSLCGKNRFRPLGSTLTPKPARAVSRMFLVLFFLRRSRTRASVSRGRFLVLYPVAVPDETARVLSETLTSRGGDNVSIT